MKQSLGNTPDVIMGLVAVSRDCFPIELSRKRVKEVAAECKKLNLNVIPCETIIESEADAMHAVAEMTSKGVNAVTIYLGNFGPEGPTTIFAETMHVPFMLVGAAEESKKTLIHGRGDAFCGMLNACLNAGLRNLIPYVPQKPVGLPAEVAKNIAHFINVARVVIGLKNLKVFSFGPRPQDFYACNAPIKPLYNLGIEIMENSELDLFELYKSAADKKNEINAVASDMAKELGTGNKHPEKLKQLAQFETALADFFGKNLGSRQYGVFADKCWPAFEKAFGLKNVCLRYFNAAGASSNGLIGESHSPEPHLIPLVLFTAQKKREKIFVFGNDYNTQDGTCIRDYIHVDDLADAHLKAINYLIEGGKSAIINLGTGVGNSVLEIIDKAKNITQKEIPFEIVNRREGDPAILVADNKKAKEILNWQPRFGIDEIIQTAWNWHTNQIY